MKHRALRAFSASASCEQSAFGLGTALYLLPRAPIDLDWYDEGIRLYGAMRVLHGAVPYHDFFAYYGPAEFYWPAALFGVFGEEALVARFGCIFFAVVGVVAVATLLRRASVGLVGLLFAVLAILLPLTTLQLYTLDPSVCLVFSGGAVLIGGLSTARLISAGALIGFASLFRHDFGLYGAMAAAATVAVRAGAQSLAREHLWPRLVRPILLVALGVLAITVPVYVALALPSPARLLDCLVIKPSQLMEYRRLPYLHTLQRSFAGIDFKSEWASNLVRLWVMLAPILCLVGALGLLHRGFRAALSLPRERAAVLTFLGTFAVGVAVYAFGRSDAAHVYPLHVVGAVGLAVLGSAALDPRKDAPSPQTTSAADPPKAVATSTFGAAWLWMRARWSRLRMVRVFAAASSLVIVGVLVGTLIGSIKAWSSRIPAPWPGARGLRVKANVEWMTKLVRDVNRYAGDAPILVTANRHDRVHKNLMTAYFLTQRASATYYQDVLPGLTTTPEVQTRIIEDLESSQARVVVQWNRKLPNELNPSRTENGSKLLDRYLRSHFSVKRTSGQYNLLLRK